MIAKVGVGMGVCGCHIRVVTRSGVQHPTNHHTTIYHVVAMCCSVHQESSLKYTHLWVVPNALVRERKNLIH